MNHKESSKCKRAVTSIIVVSWFLIILGVGACLVYKINLKDALSTPPSSGVVRVKISTSEDLYWYGYGAKTVKAPSTDIRINDKWYFDGCVLTIETDKRHPVTIRCDGNSVSGEVDSQIYIDANSIRTGYSITETVYVDGVDHSIPYYADVTVSFERVCSFWEVVMFSFS